MIARLIINGTDFTPWISEGGITQGVLSRVRRSIVALDGTEIRKEIEKQSIGVQLVETVTDARAAELIGALKSAQPASVTYTGKDGVTRTSVLFYVSGLSGGEKKIMGTTTFWSGIAFTLEER